MEQFCARWGCDKSTTYDKPLCYQHWIEWEAWELDECCRCHFYYHINEFLFYYMDGYDCQEHYPLMCDECLRLTLSEEGKEIPWKNHELERRPVKAHADIKRPTRYIYILKLSNSSYYIGQTNNLSIRLNEHKDGLQMQTKGKILKWYISRHLKE